MSDLPNPNQSRTESYLGVIVEQEGAVKPAYPISRVEQYLEYIIENGTPSGQTGSKVYLNVDPLTYIMTLQLLNKDDEVISTTSVDLPLEEMIVSGEYDAETKTLVLTLKNGEVINIPVGDIVAGLVSEAPEDNKYYARRNKNWIEIIPYTSEEKAKLADIEEGAQKNAPNTVTDANYVHTDNNFTTEEKAKLADLENYDDTDVNTRLSTIEDKEDGWDNKAEKSDITEAVNAEATARANADTTLQTNINNEATTRANADTTLQNQIDALVSKADVVDIVNTYADLQAYDTSLLDDKDVIKVLTDSTHDDARSYYRWVVTEETGAWTYVGSEAVGYTKAEADTLLNTKQNTIPDLDTIRSGAAAGATAVQDANYVHTDNNYTVDEKQKLSELENYDDTNVVKYTEQTKTDSEKSQARRNINAASLDSFVRNALIGGVTKEQYNDLMKEWFLEHGCLVMTDLTQLVQEWYKITRIGWNGGTKFAATTESSVSTGTAIGDNVGLSCTPSTNTVAGKDDYASLPMFAIKDANVTLDEFGDPHVTAIDGIPSANAFARYDTTKVVEVLQMAPWMKYSEDATSYSWEYTDEIGKTGYIPWPSAVSLKDNSVRTWVHHVKYPFGDNWTSCSGRKIRTGNISHNAQITGIRGVWGNRYCGKSCSDDAWVKHMTYIKYKSLTLDNIMNGCLSYYIHNLHPAVAEENVERIIMAASSVSGVLVGSTVSLSSADMATTGSIVDRAIVTSIEDITIDEVIYKAINVDNGGVKFNTTLESIFYTWHWRTGSTDNVLGNDGSPYSNTSTKEPYKIQGIEQIVGCYEVMGDTILSYIDGYQIPHVCRDASKIATSITSDYKRCSFGYPQPETSAWTYSKKLGFDSNLPELLYPSESGGSSSTFTRDGYYIDGTSTVTSALREWLAFGDLNRGLADGGLSYLTGHHGRAGTNWDVGGRLSSNGNRGEFEPSAA